jgi:amidase
LVNALKIDLSAPDLQAIRQHYLDVGASVDATFEKYGIDIIVGPGDCFLTNYASANGNVLHSSALAQLTLKGYPIVALPLNTYLDLNGRPVGLQAIAGKHNEALLLSFLSAYEASFSPRQPPTAYLHAEDWSPDSSQL